MQVQLVFPHQLYDQSELRPDGGAIYLIESDLLFLQYQFHQQKILFHRASMKYYAAQLAQKVDVEIRAVPAFFLNILQLKLFIE